MLRNLLKLVLFPITMYCPLDYLGRRWASDDNMSEHVRLNLRLAIVDSNFLLQKCFILSLLSFSNGGIRIKCEMKKFKNSGICQKSGENLSIIWFYFHRSFLQNCIGDRSHILCMYYIWVCKHFGKTDCRNNHSSNANVHGWTDWECHWVIPIRKAL